MMRIYKILPAFLLLPLVWGCSSESPVDNSTEEEIKPLVIRASLPDGPESRAQITYGNQDVDAGEYFLWDEGDEIFIYNITTLLDNPKLYCFDLTSFEDRVAEFKMDTYSGYPTDLDPKAGDVLLAVYGQSSIKMNSATEADERKIIAVYLGAESNKPQYVVTNPTNADLKYMQHNLKMYSIVKVTEDGVIPDLHFRHLSAIMRISFHNNSSNPIFLTKIEYDYPDTNAFFNTTMYFSVEEDGTDSYNLKFYDDNNLFNGTAPFTSSIGTTVNYKEDTTDRGENINPGDSYELYLTTVPRPDDNITGNKLTINLIQNHDTNNPFSITLDGFNVPIKAGYRYWFDLTLTEEGKLILTPAD